MDALTQARQQLDTLLDQLVADRDALDAQEAVVARAFEHLSQAAVVQAALHQGAASERDRVLLLIDHQLDQLRRGGTNAVVLSALRRMLLEVEA